MEKYRQLTRRDKKPRDSSVLENNYISVFFKLLLTYVNSIYSVEVFVANRRRSIILKQRQLYFK